MSGTVLLKCHAGCDTKDVLAAIGLQLSDLFLRPPTMPSKRKKSHGRIVATYEYVDADGTLLFQKVRLEPKDFFLRRPDPVNPGAWIKGRGKAQQVLYWLPQTREAVAHAEVVYVPEGEKDVVALVGLGLAATCNPDGADKSGKSKWLDIHTAALTGAHVLVLPDNDASGRAHA